MVNWNILLSFLKSRNKEKGETYPVLPSQEPSPIWKIFSDEDLELILSHQEELYSLNFTNMLFDQPFFQNITEWYTTGIQQQGCHSKLLYNHGQELIGFYLFQMNDATAYLMQMFVAKKYRHSGYGKILLQDYEEWSHQKGALSSFLHASSINARAVSFYESNGYLTISEEIDEQGNPRYLMFKWLHMPPNRFGYNRFTK